MERRRDAHYQSIAITLGEIKMKSRITSFLATLVVLLAWGPSAYAACTNAQFAGTWDVVFSDGNSCRLVLNKEVVELPNPAIRALASL
jgi:hypothetical protein